MSSCRKLDMSEEDSVLADYFRLARSPHFTIIIKVWQKWMDKGFSKKNLANWQNVVLHVTFVRDVITAYRIFTCE